MQTKPTRFMLAGAAVLVIAALVTFSRAQDEEPVEESELTVDQWLAELEAGTLALLPDLRVHSITTPGSASQGASISVSDVTTNAGTLSAASSVSDIYISTNLNNITTNDWVTNHIVAPIAKGKSTTWSGSVTVPAAQPLGTNYYVVVCNGNLQVSESNYNNNTNYVVIIINP